MKDKAVAGRSEEDKRLAAATAARYSEASKAVVPVWYGFVESNSDEMIQVIAAAEETLDEFRI